MKSRHLQHRVERKARPLADMTPLIEPEEELDIDAMTDRADGMEASDVLSSAAYFRAERCLRGHSPEEDWLAARAEADGQPEWRDLFREIDDSLA